VDVREPESKEWITTRALLDSGGQGSFINDNLSTRYQLPRLTKPHPISLILANGRPSKGGNINHYTPLMLRVADHEEEISLDIAPTIHHIVLGMPWLEKHDPEIRYGRRTLTFDSRFCRDNCAHFGKTVPLHREPSPSEVECNNLEEEKTDKRDESRKILPSRNLSEVSRPQVQRKTPFTSIVDGEANPLPESKEIPDPNRRNSEPLPQ
jgi:hypothetical protein